MKLFLVPVIIILAGCTGSLFGGGESTVTGLNYESIHSGSQGLHFSFLENRPQSTYTVPEDGRDFVVAFRTENKGAFDINKGIIALNTDDAYVLMDEPFQYVDLLGKNFEAPKGEKRDMFFTGTILGLTENKKTININAVGCYEYGTEFQFDVCIDTDPANVQPIDKTCDLMQNQKKYGSLSGQGGPIAITKLEQTIKKLDNSLKIQFIITIRNVGTGRVFSPAASPDLLCLEGGDVFLADDVEINAWLAGQKIRCDSKVRVPAGGEGLAICTDENFSVPSGTPAYLSTLRVELSYSYVDSLGKTINLQRLGTRP